MAKRATALREAGREFQVRVLSGASTGAGCDDALAEELISFVRANLSHVKSPRKVDFIREMPRLPTGKLPKRLIRDPYWKKPA